MGDKENSSHFLVGFIVGTVVGVAIGFLYAPKSGKETRALLKEKASELKEKASEMTGRIKGATAEAGKNVKQKLAEKEG